MGSMKIIVYEPISELEIEFFMRSKGILIPKMIIDHSPESFYLSIGLWSSYSGILVDDIDSNKECFKTMESVRFTGFILVMSGELQSIVGKYSFDDDSFLLKPSIGSSHEVCKGFGSFVGDDFNIGDPCGIIDNSSKILLFLWILSFDIFDLMDIDMYHLSCHRLLIPYNL